MLFAVRVFVVGSLLCDAYCAMICCCCSVVAAAACLFVCLFGWLLARLFFVCVCLCECCVVVNLCACVFVCVLVWGGCVVLFCVGLSSVQFCLFVGLTVWLCGCLFVCSFVCFVV